MDEQKTYSQFEKIVSDVNKIILPAIAPTIENIRLQMSEASRLMIESTNRQIYELISAQMQAYQSGFQVLSNWVFSEVENIRLSMQTLINSEVFREIVKYARISQEELEAFQAANWPVAPSMSTEFRAHIVDMYYNGKTRYVSRSILGYYQKNKHENLYAAIESWENNPFFSPRMKIVKEAIHAHTIGLYSLSVQSFLLLLEGVIRDHVRYNLGETSHQGYPSLKRKFVDNPVANFQTPDLENLSTIKSLPLELEKLWEDFSIEDEHAKPVRARRVSRHTILHGIAIEYGTEIFSLKCFLYLDALSILTVRKE